MSFKCVLALSSNCKYIIFYQMAIPIKLLAKWMIFQSITFFFHYVIKNRFIKYQAKALYRLRTAFYHHFTLFHLSHFPISLYFKKIISIPLKNSILNFGKMIFPNAKLHFALNYSSNYVFKVWFLINLCYFRYDFDNDGKITKEDVRFLLTYLPLGFTSKFAANKANNFNGRFNTGPS